MPTRKGKSRKAPASPSASSSTSFEDRREEPIAPDDVSVTSFTAKPCHCCGREITPRHKWLRNWSRIRFCSNQCRSWRPVVSLALSERGDATDGVAGLQSSGSLLRSCIDIVDVPDGGGVFVKLHVDAWMEASILLIARQSTSKSFKCLRDVSEHMQSELARWKESHDPQVARLATDVELLLSQSKAGQRELIRRSARRIIVLPSSSLASLHRLNSSSDSFPDLCEVTLSLSQNHGRRPLTTLSDVSHAKGEIEISIR